MKQLTFAFLVLILLSSTAADAQYMMRPWMGGRYNRARPRQRYHSNLPAYTPTVHFSLGYGFPNLDKTFLPEFYHLYAGSTSQKGPVTGALDYQFSRSMSIGLMVTHGTVSAPYFNYNSGSTMPEFTARYNNWSFMLDLVRYLPVNSRIVEPYFRTAIGINTWKQDYTDMSGSKVPGLNVDLPGLAYQAGIGARFRLAKNAGIFAEAGYGKYILHGGVTLKL